MTKNVQMTESKQDLLKTVSDRVAKISKMTCVSILLENNLASAHYTFRFEMGGQGDERTV